MATVAKLKKDIEELKKSIASNKTSESTKKMLRPSLVKAEKELAAATAEKPAAKKKAVMPAKVNKYKKSADSTPSSLLGKDKALIAKYKGSGVDIPRDASRRALPAGKRVSNTGNIYYEHRPNRSDISAKKYPMLEKGGKVNKYKKGGKISAQELKDKAKKYKEANGTIVTGYESTWQKSSDGLPIVYGIKIEKVSDENNFVIVSGLLKDDTLTKVTSAFGDWFEDEADALDVAYKIATDEHFDANKFEEGGEVTKSDEQYPSWEWQVIDAIQDLLNINRSEAQEIAEANEIYMAQSWSKDMEPLDTAKLIISKSDEGNELAVTDDALHEYLKKENDISDEDFDNLSPERKDELKKMLLSKKDTVDTNIDEVSDEELTKYLSESLGWGDAEITDALNDHEQKKELIEGYLADKEHSDVVEEEPIIEDENIVEELPEHVEEPVVTIEPEETPEEEIPTREVPAHFGSGTNIDIFGYHTRNYDICGAAVKEFERVIASIELEQDAAIRSRMEEMTKGCAQFIDQIFSVEKEAVEDNFVLRAEFERVVSDNQMAAIHAYLSTQKINISFLKPHIYEIGIRLHPENIIENSNAISREYNERYESGGITDESITLSEFESKIKNAFKTPKWFFFNGDVDGVPVYLKMYSGVKEIDVQSFKKNGLQQRMPKNYVGRRETLEMILNNFK